MDSNQAQKTGEGSFKAFLWDLVKYFCIALVITLPIKRFVAQPFVVSGVSMVPTFEDGEYLVIDELSYNLRNPYRGEVVVFHFPNEPRKYYIKRIIGLPGERVEVQEKGVFITTPSLDGKSSTTIKLDESFIKYPGGPTSIRTLKEDEYFVMGDNRRESSDSRFWGPVPKDLLVGRVFVRVLPFDRAEVLPGDESSATTTKTSL